MHQGTNKLSLTNPQMPTHQPNVAHAHAGTYAQTNHGSHTLPCTNVSDQYGSHPHAGTYTSTHHSLHTHAAQTRISPPRLTRTHKHAAHTQHRLASTHHDSHTYADTYASTHLGSHTLSYLCIKPPMSNTHTVTYAINPL